MSKTLGLVLLVLVMGHCCNVNPNSLPTIDGEMKLLAETTNGQKLIIGDIDSKDRLFVAKLTGTPFEMGKAFGTLFKQQLKDQMSNFFGYYSGQIEGAIQTKLPKFLAERITKGTIGLLRTVLDLNIMITKKYTNPRYYEQIKGIAAGTGASTQDIKRVNLVPELIKAACTVIGLWGPATANRNTIHMRSLDWDKNNPINKYPVAIVYLPSDPKLKAHVNVAWVGFVGSMTGVSETLTIGEKVWLPPKNSVPMTRYGNPWTYVFRDVLYDTDNLQDAVNLLSKTHRTCAIHIGLGSLKDHSFRMIEYAYKTLNVYDDNNYDHYNNKSHPQKPGMAYWDKHVQPSGDDCVAQILADNSRYGKWTAESLWRTIGLSHQTGDTQLVVFDLQNRKMFVSYSEEGTGLEAYRRRPIQVDLTELMERF